VSPLHAAALLAASTPPERTSAAVTQWPERLLLTAATLAVVVLLGLLMRRGWRRRAARQSDVPALSGQPLGGTDRVPPAEGVYVSSTTAGDWLDRITAQGLGARSEAVLRVTGAGVAFERTGAPDVVIPASDLQGARIEPGMAGKFVGPSGLVVVRWQHGERALDTGFRAREIGRQAELVDAINALADDPANREVSA
jgi:hypothetical protein